MNTQFALSSDKMVNTERVLVKMSLSTGRKMQRGVLAVHQSIKSHQQSRQLKLSAEVVVVVTNNRKTLPIFSVRLLQSQTLTSSKVQCISLEMQSDCSD